METRPRSGALLFDPGVAYGSARQTTLRASRRSSLGSLARRAYSASYSHVPKSPRSKAARMRPRVSRSADAGTTRTAPAPSESAMRIARSLIAEESVLAIITSLAPRACLVETLHQWRPRHPRGAGVFPHRRSLRRDPRGRLLESQRGLRPRVKNASATWRGVAPSFPAIRSRISRRGLDRRKAPRPKGV